MQFLFIILTRQSRTVDRNISIKQNALVSRQGLLYYIYMDGYYLMKGKSRTTLDLRLSYLNKTKQKVHFLITLLILYNILHVVIVNSSSKCIKTLLYKRSHYMWVDMDV